ncbi:MAG: alcohol dehydrogenase [Ponticaulis sp.]|nr:alcohol dehydrogenase [Ponticaulis sp.]|tara:strand:+ start:7976 stop:8773 length:798 start_codon:yes stop_codon:yes gene_type:complete
MSETTTALSYHIPGEDVDISDLIRKTGDVRLPAEKRPETVVIMAGGMGVRMMPLTKETPKPMLRIDGRPILEHVIAQMISQGFHKFVFSVRHLADQITNYFGDGSRWNVSIDYLHEPKRLGTGGGLALIQRTNDLPMIVANADLLTDLDYRKILAAHSSGTLVTMCTRQAEFQVPYGVVETSGLNVLSVVEKPTQSVTISAGMYVISPELISYIDDEEHIDMPDLIQRVIDQGQKVEAQSITDRWVDVGRRITYERVLEQLDAQS